VILPILEEEGDWYQGSRFGNQGRHSKLLMKYLESGEAQKIREDETETTAFGDRIKDLDQH